MFVLAQIADLACDNFFSILVAGPVVVTNYVFFLAAGGEYSRVIARLSILFSMAALVGSFFMPNGSGFFVAVFLALYCVLVTVIGACVMAVKNAHRVQNPDVAKRQ